MVDTDGTVRPDLRLRKHVRDGAVAERRRALVAVVACGLLAVSVTVQAQTPGRLVRIGWLSTAPILGTPLHALFTDAMREHGWIEGRHFVIESKYSEGYDERLPALAVELVQRSPDLIISSATPTTTAVKNATASIPILFFGVGDPVASGFVASLARPGGNATGFGGLGSAQHLKQLELLQEIAPKRPRIAMFVNPAFSFHAHARAEVEAAARERGVVIRPIEVRSPDDLDAAFDSAARGRADALLILGQPWYLLDAARVARLATLHRLATVVPFENLVKAGVLMSYGNRFTDDIKRLPYFIQRIVAGARPADLPVEQPTRFYLTINLRSARALGVTLPQSLLLRADALID
ncbi:MAG: ABC transporter substrate-binding protein [Caldimonas sp.]